MEAMERRTSRKQVPESDPIYRQERARVMSQRAPDALAESATRWYARALEDVSRISRENEELQARLDELPDKNGEAARALENRLRENRAFQERHLQEAGEDLRDALSEFLIDLSILFEQPGRDELKHHAGQAAARMFGAPEARAELQSDGGDIRNLTARDLLFKVGSLSFDALYAVGQQHLESMREQQEQLDGIVAETKERFRSVMEEAVAQGWLPASAETALPRLDDIVVQVKDRLTAMDSGVLATNAQGLITVSNAQLTAESIPRLKKSLFHEFLHELSGKSITITTTTIDGPRPIEMRRSMQRKSGLVLKNEAGARYEWLNEAVTEWLALRLSGYAGDAGEDGEYAGSTSYPEERRQLDRLLHGGLEERFVTDAYFENITSDQDPARRGRDFAALARRIEQLEGKGGFAKLENEHLMDDVVQRILERVCAFPEEDGETLTEDLREGARIFRVVVTTGVQRESQAKRTFSLVARPLSTRKGIISVEDQWNRVKNALDALVESRGSRIAYQEIP